MKPYEPELPEPELHKADPREVYVLGPSTPEERAMEPKALLEKIQTEAEPPAVESPIMPPGHPYPASKLSDFEASSWGPRGNRFAQFHLAGDCDVVIYYPAPGDKDCAVEIITGSDMRGEMFLGGKDTRKSTVIRLSKSKARAFASAIMGVAAEL